MSGSHLRNNKAFFIAIVLLALAWGKTASAQDTEPRRWTQIPTGVNFFAAGYAYTDGDIAFDPLLQIEDATFEMQSANLSYIRTFGFLGKSARVDFVLPYRAGRWEGKVGGDFVHLRRRGPGDARARFSVLLYGGPAETPQEFSKSEKSNTVIGAAIAVSMPTGQYNSGRLINLGDNRWVIRPQMGVTHSRGKWTGELTGSIFFYADNVAGPIDFLIHVWARNSDHLRDLAMTAFTAREEVSHIETELIFEHIRSAEIPSFTNMNSNPEQQ